MMVPAKLPKRALTCLPANLPANLPGPSHAPTLQSLIGVQMFGSNFFSFLSPEGYLVGALLPLPPWPAPPLRFHSCGDSPCPFFVWLAQEPHTLLQDFEPKESDLWGSRGVALAGLCMLFMAINNFRGTLVGGWVGLAGRVLGG